MNPGFIPGLSISSRTMFDIDQLILILNTLGVQNGLIVSINKTGGSKQRHIPDPICIDAKVTLPDESDTEADHIIFRQNVELIFTNTIPVIEICPIKNSDKNPSGSQLFISYDRESKLRENGPGKILIESFLEGILQKFGELSSVPHQ